MIKLASVFIIVAFTLQASADWRSAKKEIDNKIGQKIESLNISTSKLARTKLNEIRQRYGFAEVKCKLSTFKLRNGISNDACYSGIQNLSNALAKMKLPVSRENLSEVSIAICPSGDWNAMTFADKQLNIPWDAQEGWLQKHLTNQLNLIFATSLKDLEAKNEEIRSSIQKNFLIRVEREPGLPAENYHDGLVKLVTALPAVYKAYQAQPSQAAKLGFDCIVVSSADAGMTEDQGLLKLRFDHADRVGELARYIAQPVMTQKRFYQKIIPTSFGVYDWTDIQQFRQNQVRVGDRVKWIKENAPNTRITCVLDKSYPNSINLKECEKGLGNLISVIQRFGGDKLTNVNILIAEKSGTAAEVTEQSIPAMVIAYDSKPDDIAKRLRLAQ